MPRRVNDGIAALHAKAAQKQQQPPPETQTPAAALPPATGNEPFDFDRYNLQIAASRIAIGMRGKHRANTPGGRALAEKIAHKLQAGELLEVREMQDRHKFNPPPNLERGMARLQRTIDNSMFPGSGLF